MIKEIRKGQKVSIKNGVCLNADPTPNSKKLFDAGKKCWNYHFMGRVEIITSSPDHSLTVFGNPKKSSNEFKAMGN